jgi:DNA-binding NtrC family response regulator
VLIIDDEIAPGEAVVRLLELDGWAVECAATGAEGLARAQARAVDVAVVDLRLPDLYGLTILERLRAARPGLPVVVVTGCYAEPESEACARQLGAADFLLKPLDGVTLAERLTRLVAARRGPAPPADDAARGPRPPRAERRPPAAGGHAPVLIAASAAMRAILAWVDRVAPGDAHVLLTGETGTGKDVLARTLHARSRRAARAFVPVNCAALPEGLLEEELFGHRKGTFTGADRDRPGLLEAADGGTLFLDEVAELTLAAQGRLLRVLDDGEVRRLGENHGRRVDVRVISATRRSLDDAVARGRFREDLFYRLAVVRRHVPPLRERPEDLEALVAHGLPRLATTASCAVTGVTPDALALLRAHAWPGNVRELRNVLEQAAVLATGAVLTAPDVAAALAAGPAARPSRASAGPDVGGEDLLRALEATRWNRRQAARLLGISRSTLYRELRRLGLDGRGPDDEA